MTTLQDFLTKNSVRAFEVIPAWDTGVYKLGMLGGWSGKANLYEDTDFHRCFKNIMFDYQVPYQRTSDENLLAQLAMSPVCARIILVAQRNFFAWGGSHFAITFLDEANNCIHADAGQDLTDMLRRAIPIVC